MFLGFGLLGAEFFVVRHTSLTAHWPSVEGKVESTEVVPFYSGRPGDDKFMAVLLVTYGYSVGGVSFHGKLRSMDGLSTMTKAEAMARAAEYSGSIEVDSAPPDAPGTASKPSVKKATKGKLVTVYYNPEQPGQAVLEHRPRGPVKSLRVAGILAAFAGLLLLVVSRRRPGT
ncbi:MAG: DUF3592 domain-containing protein [Candidatus Riflebacteria bacterium]|nr:DUF3592 domain-containing protein [Candidatus Riflebacteria bacterium]